MKLTRLNPGVYSWHSKWAKNDIGAMQGKIVELLRLLDSPNLSPTFHFCAVDKVHLAQQASKPALHVQSPLNIEINRIQSIINEVKGKKIGPMFAADFLDLDCLQEIVTDARKQLRSKASQRITVLGQTGVGKSTTLNTLLSCTMMSEDDYCRIYAQAVGQASKFYRTRYFCSEGADIGTVRRGGFLELLFSQT